MTTEPSSSPTQSQGEQDETLPPPTGTLFLLMLYIMAMAGMWLSIYFEFIGR